MDDKDKKPNTPFSQDLETIARAHQPARRNPEDPLNSGGDGFEAPPPEPPKSRSRKEKAWNTFLILVAVCLAVFAYDFFYANFSLRTTLKEEFIEIPPNANLEEITDILYDQKIIPRKFDFYWIARFYTRDRQIQKGYYTFVEGMSLKTLLDSLKNGRQAFVKVTIPEGSSAKEIFAILKNTPLKNAKAYETYFTASSLIALTPFSEATNVEGFLFPETYYFPISYNEQEVLRVMVRQFVEKLPPNFAEAAAKFDLTPYQLLILASIIEKESSLLVDRHLVSSVFHNRLQRKMRLQTDPTILYTKDDLVITKKDLQTYTPYNTYVIPGLPPTPISNPSLESLQASMEPKQTKYLYFVAKGDGKSFFSEDLSTHNLAVYQYLRRNQPPKTEAKPKATKKAPTKKPTKAPPTKKSTRAQP